MLVKPNSIEEHSVYVEAQIELFAKECIKNKEVKVIGDLYSPSETFVI